MSKVKLFGIVAELADALASGASDRKVVEVQVLSIPLGRRPRPRGAAMHTVGVINTSPDFSQLRIIANSL